MMSRLHVRLQIQFPYVKVLILGVIISLLGLGEVVIGILAFTHKIWGHYMGTGLWCGIIIFISGICAITASQIRAPICAKLYFATSVVGVLVSFVMLILSSGGLDYDSNFYHFNHFNPLKHVKKHNSTVMVHGLSLGFSIGSFLLNIVSVIICMKYVVFDKKIKCATERTSRKTTNSLQRSVLQGGNGVRSSTSSRAPLAERSPRRNRSRRTSDQGNRHRSEAEDPLTGGSRSDSTRRNKERRRRREERRDTTENSHRDRSNRNEQARNRRNEIPVPVQVERMTIYDGITQADVVHNDLLPTHFNEDELPPYEEAIRDTFVPVSELNNQVLSNNVHNDSFCSHVGEHIHVCDIDEEKIYQNVNCCNVETQRSGTAVLAQVTRRAGSSCDRDRDQDNDNSLPDDVNFNTSTTAVKSKPSDRVKYVQEPNSNESKEEIQLYVNQRPVAKQGKAEKGQGKASLSTSALFENEFGKESPARRCASTASTVSMPPSNPPLKPPKFHAGRADLRDNVDSSNSDSSLGLGVQKDIVDKAYVNINDAGKFFTNGGPKLLKVDNSSENCRNKNSRYKADYIQLQIRQDPEGSSCNGDKKRRSNTTDKPEFEGHLSSSSKGSPLVTNGVKSSVVLSEKIQSNNPPKDLRLSLSSTLRNIDQSGLKSNKGSPKGSQKNELKFLDSIGNKGSPSTPSSPASLDLSDFSTARFGSPTSAFKPYKRDSSSSGLTSPMSDTDVLNSSTRKSEMSDTMPLSSERSAQKQSTWKEFMLPSPHSKTDKDLLSFDADTRKLSAVVSQPTRVDIQNVSMNTFPRPNPPTFIIPAKKNVSSSGPSSTVAAKSMGVKLTDASQGASSESYVLPSVDAIAKGTLGQPFGASLGSSSSKSFNPTKTEANKGAHKSSLAASSTDSVLSPGVNTSVSSSLSKSLGLRATASGLNRPLVHSVAQNSGSACARDPQNESNRLLGHVDQNGGNPSHQTHRSRTEPSANQGQGLVAAYQSNGNSGVRQGLPSSQPQGQVSRQQANVGQQQQQQQQRQQQGKPLFSILL